MALFGRKHTTGTAAAEPVDIRDETLPPDTTPVAPPPTEAPEFGRPTACPACGHNGYLDGIDLKRRVMFQHCPACSAKWDTSEDDLLAAH